MFDFERMKLARELQNVFEGDRVLNETVMFIEKGDTKPLLYIIDKIISVSSYDGSVSYTEGEDYEVVDGKMKVTENSRIPCITAEKYYKGDGMLKTLRDGEEAATHWGEGRAMTDWQVNVTYTHRDSWQGYRQPCYAGVYRRFYEKLSRGENVTLIFYGDSCTYGAASSFSYGYPPYQYSYALLVTNALADIFGYTVHYIPAGLAGTGPVPKEDYKGGTRSIINYINPSVGGWTSQNGADNFEVYARPFIDKYGCDLFVLDLGGNDGGLDPLETKKHEEMIVEKLLKEASDTSVTVISTLLNRPGSNWVMNEWRQEPLLLKMTEELREKGVPCGLCGITSMTSSVLEHVAFEDISGNNINHPNDFWARLYACTLFETLVGYENLK